MSAARRLLVLSRPGGMPLVAGMAWVGFWFGAWDHGWLVWLPAALDELAWLFLSFSLVHAGTMWLNAALDRDDADTLLGRPVEVPAGIEGCGVAALLGGVAAAAAVGPGPALCALACAALSVLYSHPRTCWKGHPVLGPLVNVLGYGVLCPLAGWLALGAPPTLRAAAALAIVVSTMLSLFFCAQAFQRADDAARGYRTFVVTHGPDATLRAARIALAGAWVPLLVLGVVGAFPRATLVAIPLFLWVDRYVVLWRREPEGGTVDWARGLVARLFLAGTVLLLAVGTDYLVDQIAGGPVGGMATALARPAPAAAALP